MSTPVTYKRGDGKLLYQPVAGEARQVWHSSYATDGYEKRGPIPGTQTGKPTQSSTSRKPEPNESAGVKKNAGQKQN